MSPNMGFVVVYNKPDDTEKFDTLYREHLSLFNRTFGDIVENTRILKLDDEIFYQFSIVEFKAGTDFDAVMNSSEMKAVIGDVLKFVPENKVKLLPITETLPCSQ
ncbi:EthD family reductase [uncultured Methanolobus sp.]|uniref:EthD family reductase n=1 Tax=uncultured Methanolobus sp. TaxID=218300 RepID=UPI0029C7420B|nr:EthD family reductase [uncultured Methanolobus sp.]